MGVYLSIRENLGILSKIYDTEGTMNNKIIEITKYDQELYVKIKEMEKKLDI